MQRRIHPQRVRHSAFATARPSLPVTWVIVVAGVARHRAAVTEPRRQRLALGQRLALSPLIAVGLTGSGLYLVTGTILINEM